MFKMAHYKYIIVVFMCNALVWVFLISKRQKITPNKKKHYRDLKRKFENAVETDTTLPQKSFSTTQVQAACAAH